MPADPRRLAQEAIDLDCSSSVFAAELFASHARTHYATIARALLEALDNHQFMVNRAADEKLDGYRDLGARAAAAENDRDALLADLPHALGTCGCVVEWWFPPCEASEARWPEAHTAAIARLEARIK